MIIGVFNFNVWLFEMTDSHFVPNISALSLFELFKKEVCLSVFQDARVTELCSVTVQVPLCSSGSLQPTDPSVPGQSHCNSFCYPVCMDITGGMS